MAELIEKIRQNLILEHGEDDALLSRLASAAVSYAEGFQHLDHGYYNKNAMTASTEQAVIMLASHWFESRDGSTDGFFADNPQAAQQVMKSVDALLRLDRDWKV